MDDIPDRLRVLGDDLEEVLGGTLGFAAALLPVAECRWAYA